MRLRDRIMILLHLSPSDGESLAAFERRPDHERRALNEVHEMRRELEGLQEEIRVLVLNKRATNGQ